MKVIGTAGHVDHGKSTLIRRLTGIDPDRLAEEKAREMTIDLGFAWFTLPDDQTVGVVDVPGHRDFIENMLAGIGGIDAVLLIIAADEGPMPQTLEHLQIIDLLGINNGFVVLNKIDLVEDEEWLDLVEAEIYDLLETTNLSNCEIIRVSSQTGYGIDTLKSRLTHLLSSIPESIDKNQPRLPIDRVFSLTGYGTVVTGTLTDGMLRVGDDVFILPDKHKGRIRNLQSYKQSIELAKPGTRVAVNISGIDYANIQRGNTLTVSDQLEATTLFDAYLTTLPNLSRGIKHNSEVKIFAGTASATGKIRLLDREYFEENSQGWVQIRTDTSLFLTRHERIILRFPSPPETIGGAVIVNPHPEKRWKRFQETVLSRLEKQLHGTPIEKTIQYLDQHGVLPFQTILKHSEYSREELQDVLSEGVNSGEIIQLDSNHYSSRTYWSNLQNKALDLTDNFHNNNPLKHGIPREELRSKLALKNEHFQQLVASHPEMKFYDRTIQRIDHTITFTNKQQNHVQELLKLFSETPYQPPSWQESVDIVGIDVLHALIENNSLVMLKDNVLFRPEIFEQILTYVKHTLETQGEIEVSILRDHFSTSRKYAIAILEFLDDLGITERKDNLRIKGKKFS